MSRPRFLVASSVLGVGCLFVPVVHSQPAQPKGKAGYRLEAVADTKLLMEGLAGPNLRGLAKVLADKPADAEAWGFARGQALLVAETGNLLLLRPPQSDTAQESWMKHATELRDAGAALARAAAAKDFAKARIGLAGVANACNRCHHTFRIPQRIDPFSSE
jgi:hypothetical protein